VISFVRGNVASVSGTNVVIDIGGIGLSLHCTPNTAATVRAGTSAELAASLVVREDSLTLYGFADADERGTFELLQTASGVGPRLAQAMLGVLSPDELRRAVATEDLAALTKVSGIGKKGAQRIVIELKDKLGVPAGSTTGAVPPTHLGSQATWREQVHGALLGLGWQSSQADAAVDRVAPLIGDGIDPADTPGILKAALRTLATS
jgi:Holliday junction DNA helicase RuvA